MYFCVKYAGKFVTSANLDHGIRDRVDQTAFRREGYLDLLCLSSVLFRRVVRFLFRLRGRVANFAIIPTVNGNLLLCKFRRYIHPLGRKKKSDFIKLYSPGECQMCIPRLHSDKQQCSRMNVVLA